MREISLLSLLILLLAACTAVHSTQTADGTQNPARLSPTGAMPEEHPYPFDNQPTARPYPAMDTPLPPLPAYPVPGTAFFSSSATPTLSFAPQPGDMLLARDKVTLDPAGSELLTTSSQPHQAIVNLSGYLPDPCHQLRITVSPPDGQNKINIQVYSVYDPETMCITVIKPFQVSIPLDNIPAGHYRVYLDGQLLGEFDA